MQYVDIYTVRKWFPLPLCVASRLKDHVNDKSKLPILIFPEGKCDHVERWSYFIRTSFMFVFVASKIRLSKCCCFSSVADGSLATER